MSVARKPRKDPVTGEIIEMTDEEYIALLLDNFEKLFEIEVTVDHSTGKGKGVFKRKG
jgi:hypothetical protein